MNEQENESDEYCKSPCSRLFLKPSKALAKLFDIVDAFVALGGQPNKDGYISKNTLIEIIKTEFELTIDMEVSALFSQSAQILLIYFLMIRKV